MTKNKNTKRAHWSESPPNYAAKIRANLLAADRLDRAVEMAVRGRWRIDAADLPTPISDYLDAQTDPEVIKGIKQDMEKSTALAHETRALARIEVLTRSGYMAGDRDAELAAEAAEGAAKAAALEAEVARRLAAAEASEAAARRAAREAQIRAELGATR